MRERQVRRVEGLPKTDGSVRELDLLAPTFEALCRHHSETWLRRGYVFRNQE